MFSWIFENLGTIIVGAILLAAVIAVMMKMRKDKKAGKGTCSCGGSCDHCASRGRCHSFSEK